MNQKIMTVAISIVCIFAATGLAQPFEGIVHYKMTEQTGETEQIIYSTNGEQTRIEIRPDSKETELVLLMNQEEAFVLIPKMSSYVKGKPPAITGSEKAYFKYFQSTDRQKKILDRTCKVYKLSYEGEQYSLCLTENLGFFNFGFFFMHDLAIIAPSQLPNWIKWLDEKDMAPLEMTTEDTDSNERIEVSAQSIEEKAVPASAFKIPENYRDITEMVKEMQQEDGG